MGCRSARCLMHSDVTKAGGKALRQELYIRMHCINLTCSDFWQQRTRPLRLLHILRGICGMSRSIHCDRAYGDLCALACLFVLEAQPSAGRVIAIRPACFTHPYICPPVARGDRERSKRRKIVAGVM